MYIAKYFWLAAFIFALVTIFTIVIHPEDDYPAYPAWMTIICEILGIIAMFF